MARRVLNGESTRALAKKLTKRGIPTIKGGAWHPTVLRDLLINPRIAGLMQRHGEVRYDVKTVWPAILPMDTWEAISSLLTNPTRETATTNVRRHLLSGLAVCGVCGSAVGIHRGRKPTDRAYICREKSCVDRSQPLVDDWVVDNVIGYLQREDAIRLLTPRNGGNLQQAADEANAVRANIQQLPMRQVNDDSMTDSQFRDLNLAYQAKLAKLEKRLTQSSQTTVLSGLVGQPDVRKCWDRAPAHFQACGDCRNNDSHDPRD